MSKLLKRIQGILLAGVLLVGAVTPAYTVQAEPGMSRNVADRETLEPFEIREIIVGDGTAVEEMTTYATEISAADRAYWTRFNSDYYYSLLTEDEKLLWDGLEEACLAAVTGNQDIDSVSYINEEVLSISLSQDEELERLSAVVWAFLVSHSQYYFLDYTMDIYVKEAGDEQICYGVMLIPYDEFVDGEVRRNYTEQFTAKADQWVKQINAGARPENKFKIAHDIVCTNTTYNNYTDNYYKSSAYSVICTGESSGIGYAKAMQMLLSAAGLDAVCLANMEGVVWSAVKLHGVWYQFSVVGDDADGYEGKEAIYDYYLKSRESFRGFLRTEEGEALEMYDIMVLDAPYDSITGEEYVDSYFTVGGNTYFVMNDNPDLGERLALLVEGKNPLPETVAYNGNTYKVVTQEEINVKAFVERMYTVALGRAAEEDGLEYWTHMLLTQQNDGASLAQGFILNSAEFQNKNYSNEEYIRILYRTFFDRDATLDPSGFAYWQGIMEAGNSRACVLAGFVNSVEFDNLCREYGISRGYMREDGNVINPGIWRFSERLYTKILERSSEKDGIEYWTRMIADGVATPEAAAKEFFRSPEYLDKQTSNDQYVETLYQTFMDRASDPSGKANWLTHLNNGASREYVLECFAQSEEFKGIMAQYGL